MSANRLSNLRTQIIDLHLQLRHAFHLDPEFCMDFIDLAFNNAQDL